MTFVNEEFGTVRSTVIDGEPWLVGKDVAVILGYNEPHKAIARHVDEDDGMKHPVIDSLGRMQQAVIINESGFYSLVLASKLPNAKKFKRWVTSEVLPTMRKTGGYVSDADKFVETYLPFADDAVKQLFRLQCQVINQLNDRIRRDEPKVKFSDHVSDTADLVDMNSMAKLCADHGIRIGRNRLFRWLRSQGILMVGNLPYQEFIDRGYFKVKESVYEYCSEPRIRQQTLITGKGQQYILARLMREFLTEGC